MANQNFCLKWESFQSNVTSVFEDLRQEDELVDITLCCEDERFPAHRMMLSACSPYFRDVLKKNTCQHMMFYMKDTAASDLRALVEFIYKGCVNVSQNQLPSFIKLAESLQIRGLSGDEEKAPPAPPPTVRRPVPPLSRDLNMHSPQPQPAPHHHQQSVPRRPERQSAPIVPSSPPAKRRRHTSDADVIPAGTVTLPPPSPAGSDSTAPEPAPPSSSSTDPTFPEQPPPPQSPGTAASSPSETQPPITQSSPPTLKAESVKVEKVDLTEDDDCEEEGSLEATLGQVAEYEGFDGSNQGMFSADFHQHMLSTEYGGDDMAAGSSQIIPSEDGNSQGGVHECGVCGHQFRRRSSLILHVHKHSGLTTCPICRRVYNRVADLRCHLLTIHQLSRPEVYRLVPRLRGRSNPPS